MARSFSRRLAVRRKMLDLHLGADCGSPPDSLHSRCLDRTPRPFAPPALNDGVAEKGRPVVQVADLAPLPQ